MNLKFFKPKPATKTTKQDEQYALHEVIQLVKAGATIEMACRMKHFTPTVGDMITLTGAANDVEQAGIWS